VLIGVVSAFDLLRLLAMSETDALSATDGAFEEMTSQTLAT
jgi:hypothetical protein